MSDLKTVIFIGKQGSGKGTQAAMLEQFLREQGGAVFHFQTGHAFRDLAGNGTFTSTLIEQSLKEGTLQPLFLAVWLWADGFVRNLTGKEHVIADGFPRRVIEAEVLDNALTFYQRGTVDVVNLMIDNEKAIARLLARGRSDDTEEGIRQRLEWFEAEASPVVNFLRLRPRYHVHDIDASKEPEAVQEDIRRALKLIG